MKWTIRVHFGALTCQNNCSYCYRLFLSTFSCVFYPRPESATFFTRHNAFHSNTHDDDRPSRKHASTIRIFKVLRSRTLSSVLFAWSGSPLGSYRNQIASIDPRKNAHCDWHDNQHLNHPAVVQFSKMNANITA